MVKRFDIILVNLDPTVGKEIKKTRPALVISPDEMNNHLSTLIIAPLTSTIKNYPSRIHCVVTGKKGQIVLDQIRTIDKIRILKRMIAPIIQRMPNCCGASSSRTKSPCREFILETFSI